MGGAVGGARLELGEWYGNVAPHAVRRHMDGLVAVITIDTTALLTLHTTQGKALFTSDLDIRMGHTCNGEERGEGRERERERVCVWYEVT